MQQDCTSDVSHFRSTSQCYYNNFARHLRASLNFCFPQIDVQVSCAACVVLRVQGFRIKLVAGAVM